MAKDRAKDPKRVPSLGISDPISHVRVMKPVGLASGPTSARLKTDAYGITDKLRKSLSKSDESITGKAPIVKIKS